MAMKIPGVDCDENKSYGDHDWRKKGFIGDWDHSLQCNWMQLDMNEHEEIAKALKMRLSVLRTHLAKVEHELHKPLAADSEDQAIELENQEALEVIEKTETIEINQIEAALKRISEGTSAERFHSRSVECNLPRPWHHRRQRTGRRATASAGHADTDCLDQQHA